MPKADDTPVALRPYLAHGCEVASFPSPTEAVLGCAFCGKPKMGVEVATGKWQCWKCGKSGNVYEFFKLLHSLSFAKTDRSTYRWLEQQRGLPYEALRAIGACVSVATQEWIVPQYAPTGTIVNLDRYRYLSASKKYRLMATPGTEEVGVGVYAVLNTIDEGPGGSVHVVEGAWNLAAWYVSRYGPGDGYIQMIGVSGYNQWKEGWGKFTAGRDVTLLFDNDHPEATATGGVNHKARAGVERTTRLMNQFSTPPKSVCYLSWGGESYHDATLPDGFDLNDAYRQYGPENTVAAVAARLVPAPDDWKVSERASVSIRPETCTSWAELEAACKEAFEWTPVHKGALAFALSVACSVKIKGVQLWGKLMGPGGSGKTSVITGIAVDDKHVVSESFINGLYSRQGDGKTDYSLAARLFDKCLLWKEGDALLRSQNRDVLMAELRDLYEGDGGKTFKTIRKKYSGLRFTVLIAGTGALRELDGAQLGGRFLDYYMPALSEKLQKAIVMKAIYQQDEDSRHETGITVESLMSASFLDFVKKSAGYLQHLRDNVVRLVSALPRVTPELAEWIYTLSEFVAPTRAKPSYTQDDLSEVENPVRLAKQLRKMGQVLAVVLGKDREDAYVRDLLTKIALDTSAGRTFSLAHVLAPRSDEGLETRDCARFTACDSNDTHNYLLFLSKIGVVEQWESDGPVVHRRVRWRLTPRYLRLYNAVTKAKESSI